MGKKKDKITKSFFCFLILFLLLSSFAQAQNVSNPPPLLKEVYTNFSKFNADYGGKWKISTNPKTGAVEVLTGFKTQPMSGNFRSAAQTFLSSYQKMLGVDAQNLAYKISSSRPKFSHVSYQQTYKGIPVEGGDVSVHLTSQNEILAVFSNYKPDIDVSTSPTISTSSAETAVKNDLQLRNSPQNTYSTQLTIYTNDKDGKYYLSYKVEVIRRFPVLNWIYFIDANTGSILLKYNNLRDATSGTVQGTVNITDPYPSMSTSTVPFSNQYVYVNSTKVTSGTSGSYSTADTGTVYAYLEGPYVKVKNYNGANAFYSDGSGTWTNANYSLSSPHPYATDYDNTWTITGPSNALSMKVHFTALSVEEFFDYVYIYDGSNNLVASYTGVLGAGWSTEVPGNTVKIQLLSDSIITDYGFDVDQYSYLAPSTSPSPAPSWTWSTSLADNDEVNAFYHINKVHDYYKNTLNYSGMDYQVQATVNYVSGCPNAFYSPADQSMYFCDTYAEANDVLYHEYTHGVVDHIYDLQNRNGLQSGAMSEAFADYFAATLTNDSKMGSAALGLVRDVNNTNKYPDNWVGEVHDDGLIYGGALWDTRVSLGQATADGIIFESLYFYPTSFSQGLQAILLADDNDSNLSNGTPNKTAIEAAFLKHGISDTTPYDNYEYNDIPYYSYGLLSSGANYQSYIWNATDVDLNGKIEGDFDMYKVSANPGALTVTLKNLPKDYNLYLFIVTQNNLVVPFCDDGNYGWNFLLSNSIASSANTGTADETLSYNVTDPGNYYICVRPATTSDYSTTQTYTLSATFTSYTDTTAFSGTPSTPTDDGSTICGGKIKFYWGAGTVGESKILSYYLDVGTTPGGTDVFSADVGKVFSKEITVTQSGKTYYAKVKAKNDFGVYTSYSSDSDGIIALFSVTPTGVAATAGNGQAIVSWSSVSGASSYNLYMASQSGVTKSNYLTKTEGMQHVSVTSPYTHTGLTNGTTYYFVVTSVNSCGESAESTEVSAKPVLETTPPVISSLSATDAGDTATITWTTDEASTSQVEYGTTTSYGSTTTLDANLVPSHTVILTGLSGNTSYNYRVKSTDTWGNTATSSNATFTTKAKLAYNFWQGITMISVPMSVTSSAASLFGSSLENFARWNVQEGVYTTSTNLNFTTGNGYWIKLSADKLFEATGTPVSKTQNFEITIYPGWNQIGNPFMEDYAWENVSVKQNNVLKKLTDAVAAQWIGSYAWSYRGQAFGYKLTHTKEPGASRYFTPFYGYWVYSGIEGTLVFHYDKINTSATTQKANAGYTDDILSVQIKVSTDDTVDDGNFFGVTKRKAEDDILKPPDPLENRLKTYFASGGKEKALDFHFTASQKEQLWDFVVECEGTKNVTLSWDIQVLPAGAKLFVQDTESGAVQDMFTQTSITTSVSGKKIFKIKYYKPSVLAEGNGNNGSLFASKPYMFPNPDKTGNATFRYVTAPQVVRVSIEVYNLAGKLVDKFDGNLNGETRWLFGDRVAAGVYIYRITAYTSDGKESVIGKMVVVR